MRRFALFAALLVVAPANWAQDLPAKAAAPEKKEVEAIQPPPGSTMPGRVRSAMVPPSYTDDIFLSTELKPVSDVSIDYKAILAAGVGGMVTSSYSNVVRFGDDVYRVGDEVPVPEINANDEKVFISEIAPERVVFAVRTATDGFPVAVPAFDALANARKDLRGPDRNGRNRFVQPVFKSFAVPVGGGLYLATLRIDTPDYVRLRANGQTPFYVRNARGRFSTQVVAQAGNVVLFRVQDYFPPVNFGGIVTHRVVAPGDIYRLGKLPELSEEFPENVTVQRIAVTGLGETRVNEFVVPQDDDSDVYRGRKRASAPVQTVWPVICFRPALPLSVAGAPVLDAENKLVGVVDPTPNDEGKLDKVIPTEWVQSIAEMRETEFASKSQSDPRAWAEIGYLVFEESM